jgi:hypothetical protein
MDRQMAEGAKLYLVASEGAGSGDGESEAAAMIEMDLDALGWRGGEIPVRAFHGIFRIDDNGKCVISPFANGTAARSIMEKRRRRREMMMDQLQQLLALPPEKRFLITY